jgi:predicted nucleic acid-binding protein
VTNVRVVFDASVLVRALVDRELAAAEWVEAAARRTIDVAVPALIFVEVAQAFAGYVRSGRVSRPEAVETLALVGDLPLRVHALRTLVGGALHVALERRLSVYDGCYAALAQASGATLVTADRRLAAAVDPSALLPGASPHT